MKKDAKIIFTPIKSELRKDIEQEKKKPIGCPHRRDRLDGSASLLAERRGTEWQVDRAAAEAGGVNGERERLAQFRDNFAGRPL